MGFWEPLFFWILAIGVFASSIAVLSFRSPLYSALALIVDFFCFAGLYILLSAHFMAVAQVLVYTGAIMVLFVFIIMLLNLSEEELGPRRFNLHQILAVVAGVAIFAFAAASISSVVDEQRVERNQEAAAISHQIQSKAASIAQSLYLAERAERIKQAEGKTKRKLKRQAIPTPPRPDVFLATPSSIAGLYADVSEHAVRTTYRRKLERWERGGTTPATGEYRPYREDREFVVPPALREQPSPEGDLASRKRASRARGNLFGTVEPISIMLVNRFVIPFELTAILLLAGIIGAVIIAKKRL